MPYLASAHSASDSKHSAKALWHAAQSFFYFLLSLAAALTGDLSRLKPSNATVTDNTSIEEAKLIFSYSLFHFYLDVNLRKVTPKIARVNKMS